MLQTHKMITIVALLVLNLSMTSCNMTSMITYSQGEASDVVDLSETNTPDVKPTTELSIPATAL
jgi:hypothetical protein